MTKVTLINNKQVIFHSSVTAVCLMITDAIHCRKGIILYYDERNKVNKLDVEHIKSIESI